MREKRPYRKTVRPAQIVTSTIPDKEMPDDAPNMFGYARVSMKDQSNQRQIDELVKFGVPALNIFTDTASGKNMDRPGWHQLMNQLFEGDMLVVHSIDRLGRDLVEVNKVARTLEERKVSLKFLSQDIDTRTTTGRLIFNMILTVAQFEREWALERAMHGLARARDRGRLGGAKPKKGDDVVEAAIMKHGGPLGDRAFEKAAKETKYSVGTMRRRWKAIEERKRKEREESKYG